MLRVVLVVALLVNLIACSSSPEWKGVYKTESKAVNTTSLEVPPDLSEPNVVNNLTLPSIGAAGSTYSAYTNTGYKGTKILPANPTGIKVIRDGDSQWLEINSSAEKLWPQLQAFFAQVGFEIKREDKQLGVLETNWLENRFALPTNWFSKLLSRISSTGIRDKYRARLEKTDKPNVTRVFITHQGLKEHATDEISSIKIWWETRPSDPELEAEMYQRFLVFRDTSKKDAKNLVTTNVESKRSSIVEKENVQMLQVNEGFARTWRRVGIALDRIGLFVDDRNRSEGLFYLRITEDFRKKSKEDEGWLASLFSSKKVKLKDRYLLSVSDEQNQTLISIYETTGAKADPDFVKQLLTELKSYLD